MKKPNHCKLCKRNLRSHNKSGYCSNCQNRKIIDKDRGGLFIKLREKIANEIDKQDWEILHGVKK